MPRYAAVDIGSNSVRMMVANVTAGNTQIQAQDRQVTRLGASVFNDGRIARESIDQVCAYLERMAQTFRRYEILAIRAVATSAVRDANNQEEFLTRAQHALGASIEIISGQEEARLIQLGVQSRWPHPGKRVLMIDVGGGSTEIILSDDGAFSMGFSKPLGAVRLTQVFLQNDPPTPLQLHQMDEYIIEKLTTPRNQIGGPFDRVIATSATAAAIVCAVNHVPRERRDEADKLRAGTEQIRKLFEELRGKDLAARRKILGIGPRRAELIVAGTAVFLRTLEGFGQDALFYSAAGVRDGIIADLASRGVGRERSRLDPSQRQTVEDMAKRFGVQIQHARKVAQLAGELFDGAHALHSLPPDYGKMLEAAAYLHDIGHFVSSIGHHKHSYYLVANSDMPGFTDAERHLAAWLCRYHRKSNPSARHAFFQTVAAAERRAVILLTPLLRLADSLDRGHGQRVRRTNVEFRSGQLHIALETDSTADLELWAAGRIADLFRATYEVPLVLTQVKG